MKGLCTNAPGQVKGYSQFSSVKESVSAYVTNLYKHPAYSSFRKSRAQLRNAEQEVTATAMIHKLKGYSTKGKSYNNYLFAMYQDNQRLIAAHQEVTATAMIHKLKGYSTKGKSYNNYLFAMYQDNQRLIAAHM